MIWDIQLRKIGERKLDKFIILKDENREGLELYNLFLNQKGGAIMKLLNKTYPLFVLWLGLFSISNAKNPNTISPTSPFSIK
ncbi:MAG: hypothetical protein ABIL49_01660 [candidate division WOR-3 bacterium]